MKRAWYWLWYKFDWAHAVVGVIAAAVCFIYPAIWTAILSATICILFLGYQIWESMATKDKGWPEIKGFMAGFIVVCLLGVVVLRVLNAVGWWDYA